MTLDEWFASPNNKTGLVSSDLQNAGVFDAAAGDTSILFPSSVGPRWTTMPLGCTWAKRCEDLVGLKVNATRVLRKVG